ncbi:MAG: protease inhibitor I42 family protein [Candidatus Baltobacteraceae bacterium]
MQSLATSKRPVAALFFAASLGGVAAAALNPTVFTKPGPIAVKHGDDFLIAAPANPTTGYSWTVRVSDPYIVSAEGSAYQGTATVVPGAGGEQVFSFGAQHSGHATISLAYSRPWEKNLKPAKVLLFTVDVGK